MYCTYNIIGCPTRVETILTVHTKISSRTTTLECSHKCYDLKVINDE